MEKDPITPDWSGPVCIIRRDGDNALVLCEHGTDKTRVFENMKAGKRWIKRNIVSPAERKKLFFVQAPRA